MSLDNDINEKKLDETSQLIILEYIETIINQILYYRFMYPQTAFIPLTKYSLSCHFVRGDIMADYLSTMLNQIESALKDNSLRHIFINIFDEREQVVAERYIIWVEHNFKMSDIDHWLVRPRSEEIIFKVLNQKETILKNLRDSMKLILAKIIQTCITPMPPVYVYRRWEILLKLDSDPEATKNLPKIEKTFIPSPSTGIRPIGQFESPFYNIKAAVII